MSDEQRNFLSLPRYPALISLTEACWLPGLAEHQGKILVARGMLLPAGKRRRRKGRLFVSAYILELAADREWLQSQGHAFCALGTNGITKEGQFHRNSQPLRS